jgi:hypothetical protein
MVSVMDIPVNPELANELRYALDVLEEHSHLGLDDATAGTIRDILLRRIGEAEKERSSRPVESVAIPVTAEEVLA